MNYKITLKVARLNLSILDETVRIDNGRLDIPVYFSVCGEDAARLTGTSKQMGKGATPVQAETSAVMELVERYSFYNFAATPQNFIIDTYRNLKDRAMPFDMIAKSVHDDSDELDISKNTALKLLTKFAKSSLGFAASALASSSPASSDRPERYRARA